jgi:probable non-F420 flavinoid oxidoreductase
MPTIGYHASHEQFSPRELLDLVQSSEQAGFGGAMSSDHLLPWTESQGQSGHAWSWLGAALQATSFRAGVISVPGYRYHPAVLAQAAATLVEMFPRRFWLALGSGERLNEHVTGERWPPKPERNARLEECAGIMRALWRGETVNHRGRVTVEEMCLYTRPAAPLPILGAAITPATARWLGGWADGLLTVLQTPDRLRAVIDAFHEGGGEGKPMVLQVKVAYAGSEAEARDGALAQWRSLVLDSRLLAELGTPAEFEAAGRFVRPHDLDAGVRISTDLDRHIDWLREDLELGFDELYIHNVHRDQRRFIDDFGTYVLPALGLADTSRTSATNRR